jgi:ketosteroid isomerase-like protein
VVGGGDTSRKDLNEALLRRVFDEFGDPAMIAEVFADDAEWHEPGSGPISGRYRGRAAVASLFRAVLDRSEGTFRIVEIDDVLASDRHGCVLVLVEAEHAGRYIRTTDAIVFDIHDGKIVRGRVLSEDQTEVDAFWD